MSNYFSTYFPKPILRIIYSSVICLPFLLSSCENCTYISDNVQFAAISFYADDESEVTIDTTFNKIVGVFASTNEIMPTSLYDSTNQLKTFELPIFTREDTTMFVFYKYRTINAVRDTIQDTLTMKYQVNVEVLPPDCGYDEAISNLEIIYHTFTDAEVIREELKEMNTDNPLPHIRIIR
ncbi:hypothetical protein Fleli_1308 [Bernardetia litoralis DSM 6794]|uniref:Uncharacterized protein n=1 Tax=Bernardetia litoralis (strain ATCC 23117 / DSM 6794 / NBRC 15988 / NCIMB 1366 / Fx l1 / Sio-4) TaxID=880071 RepID=I4AIF5_BERLS|nr:DUF6452 family protein [Bernardetia litoralis]AFM03740.1 hypothetical protein Fleli_1308 [Bernardetia litoralis DSM 6794]